MIHDPSAKGLRRVVTTMATLTAAMCDVKMFGNAVDDDDN